MKIKILHVDDHVLFAEGLSALFSEKYRSNPINHVLDIDSALSFCKNEEPDVILMDYFFPKGNGIDAAKTILNILPSAKIIMLTMACDYPIVKLAEKTGFKGYLSKNASHTDVFDAINTVLNNENWFDPKVLPKQEFNTLKTKHLSKREKQIAKMVAQGYSTARIATSLFISELTVSTHRKNILRKLKLDNSVQLGNYMHLFD
jgi:DNA-binding NarL/FixJ family response regulator